MSTDTEPTPAETLGRGLLEAHVKFLARAVEPFAPGETFLSNAMAAHYAAAAAWLLDTITGLVDAPTANDIAAELSELMEMGEPLADWAGEAANEMGINADD